ALHLWASHDIRDAFAWRQDERPAVVGPFHGQEERLAAGGGVFPVKRAASEEDGPPVSVGALDQVGMARASDGTRRRAIEIALREDRILLPRHERARDRP